MSRVPSLRFAGGLLVASALALVGCIKEADDVTVADDGSGSYTETLTVDLSAMKGLAEAMGETPGETKDGAPMDGGKPGAPTDDPLEKMKKDWKDIEGLEVTKATSEEKDGKIFVRVEAKFTTLEAYARATGIEMNADLTAHDDGSYTLKFSSDDKKAGPAGEPGAAMDDPGADLAKSLLPMLEPFMKDLEIVRKLTLPGSIVETNGTKSADGASVTWKVTWEDIKKGGDVPAQSVTFRGDDLELKPFSIKRAHDAGGPGAGAPPEPAMDPK